MQWYLMRHGDAFQTLPDKARLLSSTGEKQVQALADFLSAKKLHVNKILHSDFARTRQTALIMQKAFINQPSLLVREDLSPHAEIDNLFAESLVNTEDLLIVGHLPYLEQLLHALFATHPFSSLLDIQPGCLLSLQKAATQRWYLQWMMNPLYLFNS